MSKGTVREIWRYPVKSMRGERLEQAGVGALGIEGDREWAIRDEARGGICGAKKIAALMQCAARYTRDAAARSRPVPEIELPSGEKFCADDSSAARTLSAFLGREVTLWPRRPADDLAHFRRGAPDDPDLMVELRTIFGREADEPLPDLSVFPPELFEYESPPGTYFDAFPLLLITDASLARLQALAPTSRIDVRRFRPNLLLALNDAQGGETGFPEASWSGKRIRIGEVELETTVPCPRCVMITHPVEDLPKDPAVLRAVVRDAGQNLGIYARVTQPGAVKKGDAIDFV